MEEVWTSQSLCALCASVVNLPVTTSQIQNLLSHISADPVYSSEAIYGYLRRLLAAPAPNSGACLPGAVGEVIRRYRS